MSGLERRYRLLLKLLPAWYRVDREEEMVAIFLAGEGSIRREIGVTFGLAVRTRFASDGAPADAVVVGDYTRLVALLGLLAGIVMWSGPALLGVVWELGHGRLPLSPWLAADLLPLLALGALLAGQRALAKVLVALVVLAGLVELWVDTLAGAGWVQLGFQAPMWLTLVYLCLGFHRDAARPAAKPWLVAGAVAMVVGVVTTVLGLNVTLVLAAGVVVVALLRWRDVAMAWALGMTAMILLPQANFVMVAAPAELRWGYVPAVVVLTLASVVLVAVAGAFRLARRTA